MVCILNLVEINFITDIDYNNSFIVGGSNRRLLNYNSTKITNNDWHLNFKGSLIIRNNKYERKRRLKKLSNKFKWSKMAE